MRYETQRAILAAWPLAMAALVATGLPWQAEHATAEAGAGRAAAAARLAQDCSARHPARPQAAQRGDTHARTQSPGWLRQHQAEIEGCLRQPAP